MLLKALGAVGTLIYAHVGYPKSSSCLLPLKGKIPVESILRVEIGKRDTPYISDYLYQVEAQVFIDIKLIENSNIMSGRYFEIREPYEKLIRYILKLFFYI